MPLVYQQKREKVGTTAYTQLHLGKATYYHIDKMRLL